MRVWFVMEQECAHQHVVPGLVCAQAVALIYLQIQITAVLAETYALRVGFVLQEYAYNALHKE